MGEIRVAVRVGQVKRGVGWVKELKESDWRGRRG